MENLNMSQQGQPQTLNIDPRTLPNLRCPNCNNQVYQQLYIAKKVSALNPQNTTGKDSVIPIQIFACTECGAVPKEFGGSVLEQDVPQKAPTEDK